MLYIIYKKKKNIIDSKNNTIIDIFLEILRACVVVILFDFKMRVVLVDSLPFIVSITVFFGILDFI